MLFSFKSEERSLEFGSPKLVIRCPAIVAVVYRLWVNHRVNIRVYRIYPFVHIFYCRPTRLFDEIRPHVKFVTPANRDVKEGTINLSALPSP